MAYLSAAYLASPQRRRNSSSIQLIADCPAIHRHFLRIKQQEQPYIKTRKKAENIWTIMKYTLQRRSKRI